MKNNYGKLTKKKAIELLYEYEHYLSVISHKILDVEIIKTKGETDCAQILIKTSCGVEKYFISSYGIISNMLHDSVDTVLITNENPFVDYDKKEVHLTTNEHPFIDEVI